MVVKFIMYLWSLSWPKIKTLRNYCQSINRNSFLESFPFWSVTVLNKRLSEPSHRNSLMFRYENATKQEPDNEEFLSHLFMSYVRLGNLKKQQTTAMNLYKASHYSLIIFLSFRWIDSNNIIWGSTNVLRDKQSVR